MDRLQAQGIYLDFLDEPTESLRRSREGMYVSYSYGSGSKTVKVVIYHMHVCITCNLFSAFNVIIII